MDNYDSWKLATPTRFEDDGEYCEKCYRQDVSLRNFDGEMLCENCYDKTDEFMEESKNELAELVDAMAETIQDTMDELKPQDWQMVNHTDAVKLITSSPQTRSIIYGQLQWCGFEFDVENIEHKDLHTIVQAIYPKIPTYTTYAKEQFITKSKMIH